VILVQGTNNNGITIAIHATIRIAPLIKVEISLLNTTITHFVDSNGDKKKKAGSLPSTRQLAIIYNIIIIIIIILFQLLVRII
jgi:hypothetical protein